MFLREDDPNDDDIEEMPRVIACGFAFPLAADLQLLPTDLLGRSIDDLSDDEVADVPTCHRQLFQDGLHRIGTMFRCCTVASTMRRQLRTCAGDRRTRVTARHDRPPACRSGLNHTARPIA